MVGVFCFDLIGTLVRTGIFKFGPELQVPYLCYFDKHVLIGYHSFIMYVPK